MHSLQFLEPITNSETISEIKWRQYAPFHSPLPFPIFALAQQFTMEENKDDDPEQII